MKSLVELPKDLAEAAKEAQQQTDRDYFTDPDGRENCEVKYRLFQEGDPVKYNTGICFSRLVESFSKNEKYDPAKALFFNFDPPVITRDKIKKVRVAWIEVLQNANILTDRRSAEEIAGTGLTIEIDKKISPFEFYIQVALIRHMREEPRFVEYVLKLVEAGSDFWAAVFFCHTNGIIGNSGHSIVANPPYSGVKYGSIRLPMSMNRQAAGKGRVDTRSLLEILQAGRKEKPYPKEVMWRVHENVDKLGFSCQLAVEPPWRLLDPRLYPLYRVSSAAEMSEVLQHIKEEHNIVFK